MKNCVILYRAMCQNEADTTLVDQKPCFITRYKFFSMNLEFILNRVQQANFAHSIDNTEYFAALRFFVNKIDFSEFKKLNDKEYMLDEYRLPFVRFEKIEELDFSDYIIQ